MTTLKHTLALHRLSVMKNRLKGNPASREHAHINRVESHLLAQERHNAFVRKHLDDVAQTNEATSEAVQGLNKSVGAFLAMAEHAVATGG